MRTLSNTTTSYWTPLLRRESRRESSPDAARFYDAMVSGLDFRLPMVNIQYALTFPTGQCRSAW